MKNTKTIQTKLCSGICACIFGVSFFYLLFKANKNVNECISLFLSLVVFTYSLQELITTRKNQRNKLQTQKIKI